jgi:hypothetical protein
LENGIAEYWIELGLRESEPDMGKNASTRTAALGLLAELWIRFPIRVEENDDLSASILANLKRGMRDKSTLLQTACIAHLFHLLECFSEERNMFAPIVYKSLTFALVENHSDVELRETFLQNFAETFSRIQSIPIGVLIEPLVKQISVEEIEVYRFNMTDINFFA